ncbi:energy transducer TonB [Bacteroides sp. UBA939]|uniref:energy transducer TonB n=1 Tax=Bacteroides sp. UBA939 TaxID=1946092 RepID=UPI0025BAF3DD|nr:energy transducer TonB [Bacteroides sp. UBA939]
MKLLDYIRGLRKGQEAHRLEKESMQDPFLADAMDGYRQVEGEHEQRIEQLRMKVAAHSKRVKVTAHSKKKRNTYAITWSIAACLVIGIGISSYFLLLKKDMGEHSFIAKEGIPGTAAAPDIVYEEEIAPASTEKTLPDSGKLPDAKEMTRNIAKAENKPVAQSVITADIEEVKDEEILTIVKDSNVEIEAVDVYSDADVADSHIAVDVAAADSDVVAAAEMMKKRNDAEMMQKKSDAEMMQKIQSEKIAEARSKERAKVQHRAENEILHEVVVVGHGTQKKMSDTKALQDTLKSAGIPEPVIGMKQYRRYLKKNLVRPADEACAKVKGMVVLTFFVNNEGRPFNIRVKKSLCESLDQEAIRLIREGPEWTSGSRPVEIAVEFR